MAKSFWNVIIDNKLSISIWPLVFLLLALTFITAIYLFYLKATNKTLISDAINSKVDEERAKIISDFSKKDEEEEKNVDKELEIKEKLTKLIPKGSFKTTESFGQKLLSTIADEFQIVQGMLFLKDAKKKYKFVSGYALTNTEDIPEFKEGENITGQAVLDKQIITIDEIPEEYFTIDSGLGKSKPRHLIVAPLNKGKEVVAVLELATFKKPGEDDIELLNKISENAAEKLIQLQKQ